MPSFKRGQMVNIPCDVQPGAFPDEHLVTIHTDRGVISGFVKDVYCGPRYVQGTVISATRDAVTVRIPGSFFTTASGVASVSSSWANTYFQHAQIA